MTTTSPEAAGLTALQGYLKAQLAATVDLSVSEVVDEWPEPTHDLQLTPDRVVLACIRAGKPAAVERLGTPIVRHITPATPPLGTVLYDYGVLEQPVTLGLWASSRTLRDDVDLLVRDLVNRPRYDTVSLAAPTTLATAITTTGEQRIYPASLADLSPGMTLQLGTGATGEVLVVKGLAADHVVASPRKTHAAGVAIAEVKGRRETAASGLYLRCPDHFGVVAHYAFEDSVQTLDDAEGGRGSQRQEWRSLRSGTMRIRTLREVTGVPLQTRLDQQLHASTTGGTVTNPRTITVFG